MASILLSYVPQSIFPPTPTVPSPSTAPIDTGTIIDHIGNTPLIHLKRVPQSLGIKANVYAKLEYRNAGGSVKDRIVKRMVEEAEKSGKIKPGDTLIEATSGNTGIALALIAAVKGYKCIITLSEKMSQEKASIVACLGARIVRTPAGVPIESPDSIISVAKRLQKEIPNSHILDQYANPDNPLAHELGTAEEIWEQTEGKVVVIIVGAGTGGTITGTARGLRKRNKDVFVIGADPVGSVLAVPEGLNEVKGEYKVEGIGYDFVPEVCDQSAADLWIKTTDKDSFLYSRRLICEEGLLCGGSSGATIAALVEAMKQRPDINVEGKTVVLILPDGVGNYLTKFADDRWMENFGYMAKKDELENGNTSGTESNPKQGP